MTGGELYYIKESSLEGLKYIYKIELLDTHPVYEGHFPGMPVLPGVCTLQIIKGCLEGSLERKIRIGTIKECKFLAPILPEYGKELIIEAELNADRLTCKVSEAGKLMLKFKGSITE